MPLTITTKISTTENDEHLIRGQKLTDLIKKYSFTKVIFLLWRGNMPTYQEEKFLDALLIAAVEHGVEVPSLYVPRVIASTGNDMHTALAAGMLSIGMHHGGAIEACAKLLLQKKSARSLVTDYLARKQSIPGFGHRSYKKEDPRATALYSKAKSLRLKTPAFTKAYAIARELKRKKGKAIPLNIDGAMAAGLCDLKFSPDLAQALFLLSRLVGMAAHVQEENLQKNPYYRLTE